jgi:hypothetical protein
MTAMPDDVVIGRLDGPAAVDLDADVVAVYRWVFTRPPFDDSERDVGWFAEEFVGDVHHPEFRCFAARRGPDVVGFAYGFRTFTDEPWNSWYEEVVRSVASREADVWIGDCFALGWFAVLEAHRGSGSGPVCTTSSSPAPARPAGGWSPMTSTLRPGGSIRPEAGSSRAGGRSGGASRNGAYSAWTPRVRPIVNRTATDETVPPPGQRLRCSFCLDTAAPRRPPLRWRCGVPGAHHR